MPAPRILCLHGGGTNADIFRAQCRGILGRLSPSALRSTEAPPKSTFRFVFVDAPFLSAPHPAILAVYGEHGPFRAWLRWTHDQQKIDGASAVSEITYALRRAMAEDDEALVRETGEKGGEWVGVMGFSQGAKIGGSVLYAQQLAEAEGREMPLGDGVRIRFGVFMAGRAPFVHLLPDLPLAKGIADAGQLSVDFDDWAPPGETAHQLRVPTLHVHGLRDPGLDYHRRLMQEYCAEDTARCVVWDGDHRLPIKSTDVDAVVAEILDTARDAGVEV